MNNTDETSISSNNNAPGWPGIPARWTSSAKSGVGTSLTDGSPVWFTLSHGIFNEIYYPRIDQACIRDMGFIVTDGRDFFSEEKRQTINEISFLVEGVPAYRLVNTCKLGNYRIEKEILTDPGRPVLLQKTRFTSLKLLQGEYRLYALLAPHLANRGDGNTGWVDDYKGVPMLFAERAGAALALACSASWLKRSVGFVGSSDGWQDLFEHKEMTRLYSRAENGNIALTGQIDLAGSEGEFVVALAFGRTAAEAGNHARAALQEGFDVAQQKYVAQWKAWQESLLALDRAGNDRKNIYRVSTLVMHAHEATEFPGGMIASMSIPWGFNKGDEDLGGYHLAWPRDLVETACGLLAAGAHESAQRVLRYLFATQETDGHWAQNMWLDGTPYWNGIQMDETALPILLLDLARREKALTDAEVTRFWPMARNAVTYLVRNGPVSPQDRWEEDPGYSPFTVAAQIAALLAAADIADLNRESSISGYLRETADIWNASIERWMYVSGTEWSEKYQVDGYYVRIAPAERDDGASRFQDSVIIKNVPMDEATGSAAYLVSPDALALVRFGLRAADDPRILDTMKIIDAVLKIDTPYGPSWHRYNGDGYGEHADGAPFDGTGIGRAWPLLTGERAHYELAAGRLDEATRLLLALESFANEGGLIPEQIWDKPDLPERELFFGCPSGSAMPLVWAHAEYVKLCRSLRDGKVFDMPPQTVQRYLVEKNDCRYVVWRFSLKLRAIPAGKTLRIETMEPALIHWSDDEWRSRQDQKTRDTGLGIHVADLPTQALSENKRVVFTFYWPDADRWEGVDFVVTIGSVQPVSQVAEKIQAYKEA